MTPKQQRFVEEYLLDLNATQAAVRAGYSEQTARAIGSENLTKPDIAAAIEKAQAARVERTGITEARVLTELEGLAFSDLTHYTVTEDGDVRVADGAPAGAMRALQSIKRKVTTKGHGSRAVTTREVEIRLWDKPGMLKLAGQHIGLFVDRTEVDLRGHIDVTAVRESLASKLAGVAARARTLSISDRTE